MKYRTAGNGDCCPGKPPPSPDAGSLRTIKDPSGGSVSTTDFNLLILACSGPGALVEIRQSIAIGYECAVLGGLATLVLAFNHGRTRRRGWAFPVAGLLMLVHPAWTVSALGGDCGFLKREASYVFTALFLGLLIYRYVVSRPMGRSCWK